MSTELSIKLWTKNDDPVKNFIETLHAIENTENIHGKWSGLLVKETATQRELLAIKDELDTDEVALQLEKFKDIKNTISVSTQNAVRVWRFEGAQAAVSGYVPVWIGAWGKDFFTANGAKREVEGNLKVNFTTSGPFVGIIENEDSEAVQETNGYIAENLEIATDLMFSLISSDFEVESLKCFTDAGTYHPLNAHLTYWEKPETVVNDLRFISEIWHNGLSAYNVKPLKSYMEQKDKFDYHEWRTEEMREQLFENLSRVIANIDKLDENWADNIDWELYDTYDSDNGTMLLNYPLWLNGFVDDFYLDVLQSAGK